MVLDRLCGVWWEGGGFETVDRCRFLEGVASSGGRREREFCNLSYNLYLLAGAHFRTHQRLGKPSLKPMSGCCLMSSRPALRPSCATEKARSHSFNSFRRFNSRSSRSSCMIALSMVAISSIQGVRYTLKVHGHFAYMKYSRVRATYQPDSPTGLGLKLAKTAPEDALKLRSSGILLGPASAALGPPL